MSTSTFAVYRRQLAQHSRRAWPDAFNCAKRLAQRERGGLRHAAGHYQPAPELGCTSGLLLLSSVTLSPFPLIPLTLRLLLAQKLGQRFVRGKGWHKEGWPAHAACGQVRPIYSGDAGYAIGLSAWIVPERYLGSCTCPPVNTRVIRPAYSAASASVISAPISAGKADTERNERSVIQAVRGILRLWLLCTERAARSDQGDRAAGFPTRTHGL